MTMMEGKGRGAKRRKEKKTMTKTMAMSSVDQMLMIPRLLPPLPLLLMFSLLHRVSWQSIHQQLVRLIRHPHRHQWKSQHWRKKKRRRRMMPLVVVEAVAAGTGVEEGPGSREPPVAVVMV